MPIVKIIQASIIGQPLALNKISFILSCNAYLKICLVKSWRGITDSHVYVVVFKQEYFVFKHTFSSSLPNKLHDMIMWQSFKNH